MWKRELKKTKQNITPTDQKRVKMSPAMIPLAKISSRMFVRSSKCLGTRFYSLTTEESLIHGKLTKALQPKKLQVVDISGGCGSMFAIDVTSDRFKGLSIVKQHKLVNEILKDDIQKWHGLQLRTKTN